MYAPKYWLSWLESRSIRTHAMVSYLTRAGNNLTRRIVWLGVLHIYDGWIFDQFDMTIPMGLTLRQTISHCIIKLRATQQFVETISILFACCDLSRDVAPFSLFLFPIVYRIMVCISPSRVFDHVMTTSFYQSTPLALALSLSTRYKLYSFNYKSKLLI